MSTYQFAVDKIYRLSLRDGTEYFILLLFVFRFGDIRHSSLSIRFGYVRSTIRNVKNEIPCISKILFLCYFTRGFFEKLYQFANVLVNDCINECVFSDFDF